jgi:transposase
MPEAQLLKLPMAGLASCGQHGRMHDMDALQSQDLRGLTPQALEALAQRMLVHVQQQAREIARRDGEIVWRDAKIEKITFELARLKRWKFGARTEAMDAQQRQLFLETLVEDEADLQAQLAELQARQSPPPVTPEKAPQPPRRQALPEHLRRVEHHHEPADTHCPAVDCGEPMTRVGEDVSERLDIVPAEFFVHRHIRGKWVCRCCQRQGVDRLVQEPAEPQIIERGIPASGLVAYTLISRFADPVPYYRQEAINARSGVHTPRSTLAAWAGQAGAALHPLYEALKRFVLGSAVVQADETTVDMLDPGAGKTRKAYVWAYARGEFDPRPGVVYDFCPGRGSKYPLAFLGGLPSPPGSQADRPAESRDPPWSGTLVCDRYGGYDSVLDPKVFPQRVSAACAAHARRKFDELAKSGFGEQWNQKPT